MTTETRTDIDDDLEDEDETEGGSEEQNTPLVRKLRKQAREGRKAAKERDELKEQLAGIAKDSVIAELEKTAGVTLNERQRSALLKEHDGDMTVDALRATAVELGYATADGIPAEETEAHERTVTTMGTGSPASTTAVISQATVRSWPPDKWARFRKEHPDAADAVLRGESVQGISF